MAPPSIGGATSCRLAAEGALVVVGDRDLAAAERTVGLIDEADGKAVATFSTQSTAVRSKA
jgi:NAD(P)-dependent dehydrogenase (short-subunit alcohol dehydrogenase family)